MRLHKIRFKKISIVSSKEVCCQLLLTITCNVSMSTSMNCALRCIISEYCIYHSLNKHIFEPIIVNIFLNIRLNR